MSITRIGLSYHGGDADYDAYAEALERRAEVLGIPAEMVWLAGRDRDLDAAAMRDVDAICLTGGPDVDPQRYGRADAAALCKVDLRRDAIEWAILGDLERLARPTLAICRGAQILNVFHGGSLIPDLGDLNDPHRATPRKEHAVEVHDGTRLASATTAGFGQVNSSHHQAVEQVAPGFRVSAFASDGTIEAIEPADLATEPLLLAVQWHPERMTPGNILADGVLDAFLLAASLVPRSATREGSP